LFWILKGLLYYTNIKHWFELGRFNSEDKNTRNFKIGKKQSSESGHSLLVLDIKCRYLF